MALTPSPPTPQRGDRTTFSSRVDAFLNWLSNTLVPELNAYQVNLNKIAFGGAYAIPYGVTFIAAARKKLAFSDPSVVLTTNLYLGREDATGLNITTLLDTFDDSTSTIKGYFRVVKQSDASRWAIYAITSVTTTADYYNFTVVHQASTGSTAFAEGDSVILDFQRTGDKGDSAALTQVLWVRDEKASGSSGGAGAAAGSVTRALTVIKKNSISGSGVSGNQITLPAGTYRADIYVPGYSINHQGYLYNVTDGSVMIVGASATGSTSNSYSIINNSEFTISATKVFEIRQYTNSNAANGLGLPAGSGLGEVYTQVFIEKVA